MPYDINGEAYDRSEEARMRRENHIGWACFVIGFMAGALFVIACIPWTAPWRVPGHGHPSTGHRGTTIAAPSTHHACP